MCAGARVEHLGERAELGDAPFPERRLVDEGERQCAVDLGQRQRRERTQHRPRRVDPRALGPGQRNVLAHAALPGVQLASATVHALAHVP